ncbi:MAG: UbiX family flavin prenyltransferase [Bacillota bacterium]
MKRIVVCLTGASGVIYGIRLLEFLSKENFETHLVISPWAEKNISIETNYTLEEISTLANRVHDYKDLSAPIASGSFPLYATVIVPCSMKTLSSIAHGYTDNLINRAADIALKERRKLVIVPRETPLNYIHLDNMLKLTVAGAAILPPMPSFYHMPKTIDDIINQTVGKVLDILDIPHDLFQRWGEK